MSTDEKKTPELEKLIYSASEAFEKEFGATPYLIAVAPARVNLIGEHIDYCDGFVLPLAINRHIVIAAAPNGTSMANISSTLKPETVAIMLDEPPTKGEPPWTNYIRGVLDGYYQKDFWPLPGFDAMVASNVPLGAGLSSSAALEVVTATLIEGLLGIETNPKNRALLCVRAEQVFAGVPCGIMDQFASVFGKKDHMILIDCRSQEAQAVPIADKSLRVVIANTMVSHQLSDGGYANRRKQTEIALSLMGKQSWRDVTMEDLKMAADTMSEVIYRRARHVITEIERTQHAALALAQGETSTIGELMRASHESLRDDFEVSCEELDAMVQTAWDIGEQGGVVGSRMTGGGFGGSTVTLVRKENLDEVIATMKVEYEKKTGIAPEIFATPAMDGAAVEFC